MAAKTFGITAAVATVVCLFSLAHGNDQFFVEGKVYCDPCRVQFPTRLSTPIGGATVGLECRSRINETVTFTLEGKTDKNGIYSLPVDKEHEEEICEVRALSSPNSECSDRFDAFERARILLTHHNGVSEMARYANPLGFMAKEVTTECEQVLKELFPEDEKDGEEDVLN